MVSIKSSFYVVVILLVCACATPVDNGPQGVINTSKATIDGVVQTVDQEAVANAITKEDAVHYLSLVDQYRSDIKTAQSLLDQGDVNGAINKAQIINALILQLQKEVIARQPHG